MIFHKRVILYSKEHLTPVCIVVNGMQTYILTSIANRDATLSIPSDAKSCVKLNSC